MAWRIDGVGSTFRGHSTNFSTPALGLLARYRSWFYGFLLLETELFSTLSRQAVCYFTVAGISTLVDK